MPEIQVFHPEPQTSHEKGFSSRAISETEIGHVAEVRVSGGTVGGWHHHGTRTMYGYMVSGRLSLEFGPEGRDHVDLAPGDLVLIPPQMVHRDVNRHEEEARILVFNIGQGASLVEVPAPQSIA
jgi:uncharacterized RmlC-like cupin family protein